MNNHPDRHQPDLWRQEQHDLQTGRELLKKEVADVEALTPELFLEALDLDERTYQEPPMSLPEIFADFDWLVTYEDMVPGQKRIIWEKIYEILGIDINSPILDRYQWTGDESSPGRGEATITVSATRYNGLALHHIAYADGVVDIAIGRSR